MLEVLYPYISPNFYTCLLSMTYIEEENDTSFSINSWKFKHHKAPPPCKKKGRKPIWTSSYEQLVGRLYVFSTLPVGKIVSVLEYMGSKRKLSEETVKQKFGALLDRYPNWLRPKTREQMNKRVLGLEEINASILSQHLSKNHGSLYDERISSFLQDTPAGDPQPRKVPLKADYDYREVVQPDFEFFDDSYMHDSLALDGAHAQEIEGSIDPKLRRRLSGYSSEYIRDISRLIKTSSMSQSSVSESVHTLAPFSLPSDGRSTLDTSTSQSNELRVSFKSRQEMPIVLSGSFLELDSYLRQQGICLPGMTAHDKGNCWCTEHLLDSRHLWVNRESMILQDHINGIRSSNYFNFDSGFVDPFGNTALHMLAARGASLDVLLGLLDFGFDGNAKNSSGQNCFHLLSNSEIQTLATNKTMFLSAMRILASHKICMSDCDFLGRNLFHRISHASQVSFNQLFGSPALPSYAIPTRNVAGWDSTHDAALEQSLLGSQSHRRFYSTWRNGRQLHHESAHASDSEAWIKVSSCTPHIDLMRDILKETSCGDANLGISGNSLYPNNEVTLEEEAHFHKNAHLMATARYAFDEPTTEDTDGRNGFQCVAEVVFLNSAPVKSRKRPTPGATAPCLENIAMKHMQLRFQLVLNLIYVGVDRNNYDRHGNTVLMAFVTHLVDGEDDKTLQRIFEALIKTGANVHWRNRQGESALHIAVRLGRKVATKVLLENGANVHARTAEDKGVIAVGGKYSFEAREVPKLYASIKACMALCWDYGAVATPTRVQEWMVTRF